MSDHIASFWEYNQETNRIHCLLCPQFCKIPEGKIGLCKTRKNFNGTLYALNYAKVASIALDPIEKKPLYHFFPGKNILSLGTYGCNMRCSFCQNFAISQQEAKTRLISSEEIISLIPQVENNIGIAFTYNELFMWYEFMFDTAKLIKEKNNSNKVIVVTNGYVNPEPLERILPYIDALNIDLKTYKEETYHKLCGATLNPVKKTIALSAKKCHVEVTTLMIRDENDSLEEIEEIAKYISSVDPNIPLHLSRYFPNYKMTNEATDINQINKAKEIAEKYLNYVYTGNISNSDNNTYCLKCGYLLIARNYRQITVNLKDNICPKCHHPISIQL